MIRIIKKIIICTLLFIVPITSNANTITENFDIDLSKYQNFEYVLTNYNIDITVNENNTLDVTENISAYFDVPKHGIFRKIPLKNKVERLDGTISYNRSKISNIVVNEESTIYNENGYRVIKIGDPDYEITGPKSYTIKYIYNLGKDTGKGYDELYFNLIGDEWDTLITNITFTIHMPKEFDKSKLGFSSGKLGSTDSSKITYHVNGNNIIGKLNDILEPGEALTIRLELPEGYFVGATNNFDFITIISLILPILFVLIAYILWRKYGKDDQVVETVEFYPPEGFNSLEVGFLFKGKAGNEDVTSLLIYLANKGYLKISEIQKETFFSTSKDFKITKLKEYDGNNINEQTFLQGLFLTKQLKDIIFGLAEDACVTEVTSEDLRNSFYRTKDRILTNINCKENKSKIFENISLKKTKYILMMIIITFGLITIPPIYMYEKIPSLIICLLFTGVGITIVFKTLINFHKNIHVKSKSNFMVAIFGTLLWGSFISGIPFIGIILPALKTDSLYLIVYIIGIICIFFLTLIWEYISKRNKYGNEILGKLKGFKTFLETVEKEKLEALVNQNPTYFYDILPYTYVLGVSDKWIKKFETINLQSPSWYDGYTSFDAVSFGNFINETMSTAQSAMSSSPSSGSDSGGGFSGGGSGGGGGGSW